MSSRRDSSGIIQISLGPSANAVTAHLLNLQGLACTSSSSAQGDDSQAASKFLPVCDSHTTHFVESNFLVPRVILVDEAAQVSALPSQLISPEEPSLLTSASTAGYGNGGVEILDSSTTLSVYESPLATFLNTSSVLAYNSHSRYYQPPSSRQDSYQASSSNPRHVVWDDDEPENNEELEEDPQSRALRRQREQSQWQQDTKAPLQEKLTEGWNEAVAGVASSESSLTWNDYLMPPYSQKSKLALPYSHQSTMTSHWDQFMSTRERDAWYEEELSEKLRHLLEESDYCQGVTIATEGSGIYAGLTTSLLQELQEECKSAGRMVYHVTNPKDEDRKDTNESAFPEESPTNNENESPLEPARSSWHSDKVDRVRKFVQRGMVLSEFVDHADVVVPLLLPQQSNGNSLFRSSAQVAMALESATLPFRLDARSDPRYKISLINAPFFGQGGMDSRWGTTAQRLSFGEFLSLLTPSRQHSLVELEAMAADSLKDKTELSDHIKLGSSVQRDQRMRDEGRDALTRQPRQVLPGGWLEDKSHGGLLSSFSLDAPLTSRSSHHHFALSTSIRSNPLVEDELQQGMSQYLTCLVEGMGVRYRPERSMSTVLDQSFSQLVGDGYGSEVYWDEASLYNKQAPVMAVLGNTTRMHPFTDQIALDMKRVFSLNFRGLYNRDVMHGVLPEIEDAQEALSRCYDVRDSYHPPGYDDDDDVDIDV